MLPYRRGCRRILGPSDAESRFRIDIGRYVDSSRDLSNSLKLKDTNFIFLLLLLFLSRLRDS